MGLEESVRRELQNVRVSRKRVAVQIPEGLKRYADVVVDALIEKGAREVILFVDPNYGACDVRDSEARRVGAEVLVHVGHNRFGRIKHTEIPVIYVPVTLDLDVRRVIEVLKGIPGKIALCSTVHYLPYLKKIRDALGDRVVVGMGALATEEGQVLGCDPAACSVEADVNVIVTDGVFHGILARMQTGRKTYILTPAGELIDVEPYAERYIRQRETAKLLASRARRVGVVITTKRGQMNTEVARELAELIEGRGVRADILACDYFFPEYVKGMPYDAYVFTGCPRVPVDDFTRFDKPVLTVAEALEVWGGRE